MDNLGIFRFFQYQVNPVALCADAAGEKIIISKDLDLIRLGPKEMTPLYVSPPLPKGKIFGVHSNSLDNSILLCFENGDLVLCNESEPGMYSSEVIGSIPSGVKAFSTSPDNELVSMVDQTGKLIVLLRSSLTMILEADLFDAASGWLSEHVSVGWGRKETQFHGSAGKQAALEKVVVEEHLVEGDDMQPRLSGRNDGAFLACSFIVEGVKGPHRRFIVMNREGAVTSVNDLITGLGHSLAWRQDGTLIATSQRVDGKNKIVFFERNGLYYSDFTLQDHENNINEIYWNCNGTVLAIHKSDGCIELWTVANSHWYLKQKFDQNIVAFWWDEMNPLKFFYSTDAGSLISCELFKTIDRSLCNFEDELCMVAVVDGSCLLLTPFALANIPPPLSFAQINLGFVPRCISVHSVGASGSLVAASSTGLLFIVSFVLKNNRLEFSEPKTIQTSACLKQICQNGDDFYGLNQSGRLCILQGNDFKDISGECGFVSMTLSKQGLLLLDDDGSVFALGESESALGDADLELLGGNLEASPWLESYQYQDRSISICRTLDDRIVVDGNELVGCTSFILHPEFLTTTDRDGVARFYPLDRDPMEWLHNRSEGEEMMRHTEGGAICVAVVPKAAALIVQMPRGNLETVYPRAFVLLQVRRFLNSLAYRDAFLLCRRHRVDLNILHDNNPELFMSTINKFVQDIKEADYLNLFMSSLNSANVVVSRYGSFTKSKGSLQAEMENKVNDICEALRNVFLKSNELAKVAECIMTSYVCQNPPDYLAALKTIVELTTSNPTGVEGALRYLIFLVPAEKLYKAALGLYNLQLALSVARRSQMDPSEYTTFLEELYEIKSDESRMFRIDDHLGKYEIALAHLIDSGESFEQCMAYIERHELYATAFAIYKVKNEELWRIVCKNYAGYLLEREKPEQAIDLAAFSGDLQWACDIAVTAGHWKQVLQYSSQSELSIRCKQVAKVLTEKKKLEDAFRILELCGEGEDALKVSIEGHLWMDASRIVRRNNLDSRSILFAALESKKNILEELKEVDERFEAKSNRLELVQTQLVASLDPEKIRQELERVDGLDSIADGMSAISFRTVTSFAGSQISQLSRATSSKSKKKADRQRMRSKPGSPFEREYLRDTIKDCITRFTLLRDSSIDLVHFLANEQHFEDAKMIQDSFDRSVKMIVSSTHKLKRLVTVQEEKMGPEILAALGLSPWSVPSTLQIDHTWKTAFDLSTNFGVTGRLEYL